MHSLARLYDEIGDHGVSCLLQLHRSCKAQQISNDQIVQYLTVYGHDLQMVKREYDDIDTRLRILLSQKARTENELQDLHTTIGFSSDMLKSIQTDCETAEKERNNLAIQKLRLLRFISDFKRNNVICMRIERIRTRKSQYDIKR